MLLELGVVGRKDVRVDPSTPGSIQARLEAVELLQLASDRVDGREQFAQLGLLAVELGGRFRRCLGRSLLGCNLLFAGALGVVVGIHRRRLRTGAFLPAAGGCPRGGVHPIRTFRQRVQRFPLLQGGGDHRLDPGRLLVGRLPQTGQLPASLAGMVTSGLDRVGQFLDLVRTLLKVSADAQG
ncbi:hypothetical protein PAERUG_P54_1_London_24_VIM_2_04_13_05799 [Pseudomonas aeruginosa]|nr:hypothetical protein PAERUG_P54_1_London_24_VIM_2_04_13_05799 [Pseudomonas aeruginosa]